MRREEEAKKTNSSVFPGNQGGPLMHAIAGKAIAFREAATSEFKEYQKPVSYTHLTLPTNREV